MVWKLDRLWRSIEYFIALISELEEKGIHSILHYQHVVFSCDESALA
ncbi:MAG: hypothetical protein ACTS73_02025 [Arsenophonus sp. NEOnobi-MAG3]